MRLYQAPRPITRILQPNRRLTGPLGTTPDYLEVWDIEIDEGQPFTTADVEASASVVLLGKTVADN